MRRKLIIENNRQRKNYLFEILVSVLLITVFVLVFITGFLSHQRLNLIIETVKSGIRPDRKLILVKEINNNITEAENSVKSFSLTRSGEYLVRFYELTENTGRKFEELAGLILENDPLIPYIDTLNNLVGEKFSILDRLLSIQDEFRVQQAMQQVENTLREAEISEPAPSQVAPVVVADTIKPEVTAKKENFFSKLFKRKNKKDRDAGDTLQQVVVQDTLMTAVDQPQGVPIEKISKKVEKVREEVMSRDRQLRREEWELLQQDKAIMKKIRQLIAFMEEKEKDSRLIVTKKAELKAMEIKRIIMAFGLAASFFILLAALVIYRYIRRNNEYKAVLVQARKEAEELARAKEIFLASMSHEIRTPMNVISGFLEQVMKGPLDPAQAEQLQIVKKSSDHLLQLLNDLLDLSKLQAGRLELVDDNFNPSEIIGDVIRAFLPAAQAKNILLSSTIDQSMPGAVFGDAVRLRQILFNLVGNAIKFTGNGTVSLKAYPIKRDPGKEVVAFEVADTGIGINADDLEKIFGEFEKAGTRAGNNREGAGLGLAITKKLVKFQGGDIRVSSSPGKGSVFTVEIPYGKIKEDIPQRPGLSRPGTVSLKDMRVLVVDDDEYNRHLARIILQKYGCLILEAANAENAIELAGTAGIDLVLMDIHLPGMNGPEAAGEIKRIALKSGKSIPVIAVSASISKGDLEHFRQSGLDDFILKPYDEYRLVEMIARYSGAGSDRHTGVDESHLKNPSPGYDLGTLKNSSGGSDAFVKEMIGLFLADTENGLNRLKALIEQKDWPSASELAHKMISPCRHLKADRLAAFLKEIENLPVVPLSDDEALAELNKARLEFERISNDIRKNIDL